MIKCSVVITNYNYSKYLNRSIHSALSQNFRDTEREVIVVDDYSTDNSKEIVESYKHLIKPIYLKENCGISYARNYAIDEAKGEYIVFLDADDYINRDLLYIESLFLDYNPSIIAVSCDYLKVNNYEEVIKRCYYRKEPIACGIMFRKWAVAKLGYNEDLKINEEVEFMKRFLDKGWELHNIELPLYRYRKHGESLTDGK